MKVAQSDKRHRWIRQIEGGDKSVPHGSVRRGELESLLLKHRRRITSGSFAKLFHFSLSHKGRHVRVLLDRAPKQNDDVTKILIYYFQSQCIMGRHSFLRSRSSASMRYISRSPRAVLVPGQY